jgi:hypothetical protein
MDTNADLQKLVEAVTKLGKNELDLDELVHDMKSGEAASINNGGVPDQCEYILSCFNGDVNAAIKFIKGEPNA